MQTAHIYIHPTAIHRYIELEEKTGRRAVICGRWGMLVPRNPRPTPAKAARTQPVDNGPWGGDAA